MPAILFMLLTFLCSARLSLKWCISGKFDGMLGSADLANIIEEILISIASLYKNISFAKLLICCLTDVITLYSVYAITYGWVMFYQDLYNVLC